MLSKTTTILEQWDFDDYRHVDDEGYDDYKYQLILSEDMVRELGYPDKITVTIEPGDKLNDPVKDRSSQIKII